MRPSFFCRRCMQIVKGAWHWRTSLWKRWTPQPSFVSLALWGPCVLVWIFLLCKKTCERFWKTENSNSKTKACPKGTLYILCRSHQAKTTLCVEILRFVTANQKASFVWNAVNFAFSGQTSNKAVYELNNSQCYYNHFGISHHFSNKTSAKRKYLR